MSLAEFPFITSPEIRIYCEKYSGVHSNILEEIYQRSLKTQKIGMVSGPFLGRFLSMISKITMPKYVLELGTFTGYGAVCLSEGLQEGGKVITIEKNKEMMHFSTDIFERENISEKIVQLEGDAGEVIAGLDYTFDLVFLDAAKRKYIDHYELILPKLKKGK